MATIHDEIDGWLAADLHGELSNNERNALHAHLVDCGACRKTHQENKLMNKILEETLAQQKADPAFEQRMLAGFRNRVPQRSGPLKLLADLMRLRAVQISAVTAILLALVHVGRMLTSENVITPRYRGASATVQIAAPSSQTAPSRSGQAGTLAKSAALAGGRSQAGLAVEAPPPSSLQARDKTESFAQADQTIVTGSNIPNAAGPAPKPA